MLRYRGYDWTLVHGESRFEVNLGHAGSAHPEPLWWLRMMFIATGPEWRRCDDMDRPHMSLEISSFHVKPGDWRNLAEVDYWNRPDSGDMLKEMESGWFDTEFLSSYRETAERETTSFGEANWRVVRMDGPHITVEVFGGTDVKNGLLGTPEMAATAPGGGEEAPPGGTGEHEVYLLETVPFGVVTVKVPRNARDPYAYAEQLARRHLKTPPADHMVIRDHKDYGNEMISGDLYVNLHLFGYHES